VDGGLLEQKSGAFACGETLRFARSCGPCLRVHGNRGVFLAWPWPGLNGFRERGSLISEGFFPLASWAAVLVAAWFIVHRHFPAGLTRKVFYWTAQGKVVGHAGPDLAGSVRPLFPGIALMFVLGIYPQLFGRNDQQHGNEPRAGGET